MTLQELLEHVLFQTNNDVDDLEEYQPSIERYINEGYDRLIEAYDSMHLDEMKSDGTIPYQMLSNADDEPKLPSWMHRAIGDYATYMMYRNGNAVKQNRGVAYYQAFAEILSKARTSRTKKFRFTNLYTEK